MNPTKLNIGSKDVINTLPEALIHHILSFLPTREAASTSLLSRKWRYLFAFVPNLDFDDPLRMRADSLYNQEKTELHRTFIDFVDRVLGLQGKFPVNGFSLRCGNGVDDVVVTRWILKALELGVTDLDLRIALDCYDPLFPPQVLASKSLVRLRIGARNGTAYGVGSGLTIDVDKHVSLPKLKTLYIDSVMIGNQTDTCLDKLLSGCHVLEELTLIGLLWFHWESCSLSVPTLKRLTLCVDDHHEWPKSVTFDAPALVYFEYSDTVALKYPKVNLDSLVEASLRLKVGYDMVGDATNLLLGISNVQILYLSASTLEVLTFCCKAIPIFNNLTRLTIESNTEVGWESLPNLLNNCPNLKTLVFKGLQHKATDSCGNVCRCKAWENVPNCLSSSPVKALKIKLKFGGKFDSELEQIKHFLESMPHLEKLTIYYDDASTDDSPVKVSEELHELPSVASPKCKIQVISNTISLSFTVPSSSSMKWIAPLL
ncbi:unnamed protein product [Microthlaspi erraticum]|uniref:F-box domain-containing protein n=1 Tax=Microthlaspi erraticum TaxID=1685480 RepID=A0A6D2HKK9_9BRAS|nr:unnamed protein product [Microthlaspi erraticum]CAA7041192.1 unnamed protein product [Microthlaspi erraticum]